MQTRARRIPYRSSSHLACPLRTLRCVVGCAFTSETVFSRSRIKIQRRAGALSPFYASHSMLCFSNPVVVFASRKPNQKKNKQSPQKAHVSGVVKVAEKTTANIESETDVGAQKGGLRFELALQGDYLDCWTSLAFWVAPLAPKWDVSG